MKYLVWSPTLFTEPGMEDSHHFFCEETLVNNADSLDEYETQEYFLKTLIEICEYD